MRIWQQVVTRVSGGGLLLCSWAGGDEELSFWSRISSLLPPVPPVWASGDVRLLPASVSLCSHSSRRPVAPGKVPPQLVERLTRQEAANQGKRQNDSAADHLARAVCVAGWIQVDKHSARTTQHVMHLLIHNAYVSNPPAVSKQPIKSHLRK